MVLDKIVEDKKLRLNEHRAKTGEKEMRRLADEVMRENLQHPSFYAALAKTGISIIGEFKKASPSLGRIESPISLTERIEEYNQSVDAISCLTEEDHFSGSAGYLQEIRGISPLPILRKDFMIEEYQFYEARAIGADAILLIAAILDDVQLHDFCQLTKELGMDALVEVHDELELERALKLDAQIIGINNRDLHDFSIRLETTKRLVPLIPHHKILVSESGIVSDEDVKLLKECRVDAFLIGRAFMEAKNPRGLAERWKLL